MRIEEFVVVRNTDQQRTPPTIEHVCVCVSASCPGQREAVFDVVDVYAVIGDVGQPEKVREPGCMRRQCGGQSGSIFLVRR